MDKRKKIIIPVIVLAALAVIYAVYQHVMYVSTDNAQVEAHTVMLGSKVQGFVTQVHVVEGQKVKAGEVLVEIDERDYRNALTQVKGEISSIEAQRRDAERTYNRMSELFKKDAVSRAQFDQATAGYAQIRAKYEAIAAQVSQAELNLENTKIRAPSDGFIARKSVDAGQLATPGTPLIGFVDGRERWVVANFKETELEDVVVGRAVDIDVDAISSQSFHGTVFALSAATGATFTLLPPDNATGNFTKVVQRVPVRIKLENLTEADVEKLRAGLSANVKVHKH